MTEILQRPAVGRIVHFYTKDATLQSNGVGEGPYAAIIVQPHGDTCASLRVFPPFAAEYEAGSVPLGDDAAPHTKSHRWWAWPPST